MVTEQPKQRTYSLWSQLSFEEQEEYRELQYEANIPDREARLQELQIAAKSRVNQDRNMTEREEFRFIGGPYHGNSYYLPVGSTVHTIQTRGTGFTHVHTYIRQDDDNFHYFTTYDDQVPQLKDTE